MDNFRSKFAKNSYSYLRSIVQIGFLITVIYIGYQFTSFVSALETGNIPDVKRPPGVEAFLPISALISLKYFFLTGIVNDVHPSGLIILALITLVSLLVKKSFCSWICPIGLISEYLTKIHHKIFKKGLRVNRYVDYLLRSVKYLLLIFFLWTVFFKMNFFVIKQFLFSPYNIVSDIKMLKFFTDITPLALTILISIFVLSILIKNFWCRYLCPYGAFLGFISFISPYKVRRDEKKCTSCKICDRKCPSDIEISSQINVVSDECFACGKCIDACPEKDTLKLTLPGSKLSLKPLLVALLVTLIFTVGSFSARLAGKWNNSITAKQYMGYMMKTGLIDITNIKDMKSFINNLDRAGKRQFMMQMMGKGEKNKN